MKKPKKQTKKTANRITKKMAIGEVVQRYPETFDVFARNGLHCIGCSVAAYEDIEQGANVHGIDANKLVKELNEAISRKKK